MAIRSVVLCSMILVAVEAMDLMQTSRLKKCNIPTNHYIELGCSPVYSNGNISCPERFECPLLTTFDSTKCYYKSKEYDLGEVLDDHGCYINCRCEDRGTAAFECNQVHCSYEEGWSEPTKEGCVHQHSLDSCCSYKMICDAKEMAALATCKYKGRTYREGEQIDCEDSCQTCICSKGFDGTLKSLQCSEQSCGVEIHHGHDAREGCAPVYHDQLKCCPLYWRCPVRDDKIIRKKKSDDFYMQCKYGEEFLDVGDEVMMDDGCVTCRCSIPPLVSCSRTEDC